MCKGLDGFTKAEAKTVLRRFVKEKRRTGTDSRRKIKGTCPVKSGYLCRECGLWHVGHGPSENMVKML